jgi:hypothetical protein
MKQFAGHLIRKGSTVELRVSPVPTELYNTEQTTLVYSLMLDVGNPEYAELLKEHFANLLGELMEGERRNYYDRGWKDAKSKKAKHTWFSRSLRAVKP